jgi:hypothetical protein
MSPEDRLESSVESIERRLKANPEERIRLVTARMLAFGLADSDSRKRAEARNELMLLGKAALPVLLSALADSSTYVRWQAAKALSQIHDPETAPDLVNAMEDKDFGVRWLAAEGLIAMGPDCLETALRGLRLNFSSLRMREGVMHVLHALTDNGYYDETIEALLHVLQGPNPAEEVAWATEKAWEKLRAGGH